MTKPEFAKMAALVVRMRKDLESHTEAHVKSETETMAIDKDAQQTDEAGGDWRSRSYDIYLMDCGQLTREVRVINGRIAQVDGFSGDLIGYPLKDCPLEGEAIVIGDLMGGTLRDPFHIDNAPVLISSVVELQSDLADPGAEAAQDLSQEGCAQCAWYLRQNEQLHSELVTVRAALASVSAERDSYKRTLDEWSNADTAPHERVGSEEIADHVVPPVLPALSAAIPKCTTCHGCGASLSECSWTSGYDCPNPTCDRTCTGDSSGISPYEGTCYSETVVRHA